MNGDDADEVVREAGRAVYHSRWRIWEELALEQRAAPAGLGRAPLVPGSEVIQLGTWDAEHIGHVRRDTAQPAGECWVAVASRQARPSGRHDSAEVAARGVGRACGKGHGLRR